MLPDHAAQIIERQPASASRCTDSADDPKGLVRRSGPGHQIPVGRHVHVVETRPPAKDPRCRGYRSTFLRTYLE
jgi:hypothetical protein